MNSNNENELIEYINAINNQNYYIKYCKVVCCGIVILSWGIFDYDKAMHKTFLDVFKNI